MPMGANECDCDHSEHATCPLKPVTSVGVGLGSNGTTQKWTTDQPVGSSSKRFFDPCLVSAASQGHEGTQELCKDN